MKNIIEVTSVRKTFGKRTVLNDLNLSVREGEIYGFLGPNGAGKTTTIRILLGLLRQDSGIVSLFGSPIQSYSSFSREKIGIMNETSHIHPLMTVREYLNYFRGFYSNTLSDKEINKLLEELELIIHLDQVAINLSAGMKKKLSFARALINRPSLLVLDEPVSNLDPQSIYQVRKILLEQKENGCSILLSSHILSETEKIADRIGIINNGSMISEEPIEELRNKLMLQQELSIETYSEMPSTDFLKTKFPGITTVKQNGQLIQITCNKDVDRREVAKEIYTNGGIITNLQSYQPTLEASFLLLIGQEQDISQENNSQTRRIS